MKYYFTSSISAMVDYHDMQEARTMVESAGHEVGGLVFLEDESLFNPADCKQAIERADVVVIYITKYGSFDSFHPWEVGAAFVLGKPVVVLSDVTPNDCMHNHLCLQSAAKIFELPKRKKTPRAESIALFLLSQCGKLPL